LAQGKVTFILDNPGTSNVQASVVRFDAGETWQQLVNAFAEKNKGIEYPVWASFLSARPVLDNLQAKIYELTPGSYGITCEEFPPEGTIVVWLAAPFEVR
jgi:hypothetical protein